MLIKNDNTLNREDFIVMDNCSITVENVTVNNVDYTSYIRLNGGNNNAATPYNAGAGNLIRYDAKTTITEIEFVAYNAGNQNSKFYYTVIDEGDTGCTPHEYSVNKSGGFVSQTGISIQSTKKPFNLFPYEQ
jgi:hypothetical protein